MVKCRICASEWKTNYKIEYCPFCGAALDDKIVLDASSPTNVLKYIINIYGTSVICDQRATALFKDLAPDLQEQASLIGIAVSAGTFAEVLTLKSLEADKRKHELELCKERLKKKQFLADEFAAMPISWLVEALGWNEQSTTPFRDKRQNRPEEKRQTSKAEPSPFRETMASDSGKKKDVSQALQPTLPVVFHAPFSFRDCQSIEWRNGNGSLSFSIPPQFDYITENGLTPLNSEILFIPATIRGIHERAFLNAGPRLSTVFISSRNPQYKATDDRLFKVETGDAVLLPLRISVRTYIDTK